MTALYRFIDILNYSWQFVASESISYLFLSFMNISFARFKVSAFRYYTNFAWTLFTYGSIRAWLLSEPFHLLRTTKFKVWVEFQAKKQFKSISCKVLFTISGKSGRVSTVSSLYSLHIIKSLHSLQSPHNLQSAHILHNLHSILGLQPIRFPESPFTHGLQPIRSPFYIVSTFSIVSKVSSFSTVSTFSAVSTFSKVYTV